LAPHLLLGKSAATKIASEPLPTAVNSRATRVFQQEILSLSLAPPRGMDLLNLLVAPMTWESLVHSAAEKLKLF
jgi:hypothetical protein